MRPAGAVLDRRAYVVEGVPLGMGRSLVAAQHYAGGSSNTATFRHGLFRSEDPMTILGFAQWLPPTAPAARSVSTDWRGVLCLSRLVVDDDVPTNGASFLLGRSIRIIRHDGRFHTLLTYADEAQGHTGAIYRATNFEYLGVVAAHPRWTDDDGRQVATKATKNRTYAEMLELGYRRSPGGRKHKFVLRLEGQNNGDLI